MQCAGRVNHGAAGTQLDGALPAHILDNQLPALIAVWFGQEEGEGQVRAAPYNGIVDMCAVGHAFAVSRNQHPRDRLGLGKGGVERMGLKRFAGDCPHRVHLRRRPIARSP